MYYDYFKLKEHPFRLNTDARFLFLSKEHAEAKAYLEYALLNHENLLVLSGEIGSGKSIVVESVIEGLEDEFLVVKIHQTLLTTTEFLQMLLLKFGIKSFHDRKVELLDQIHEFLLEQYNDGRRVLLVIDEAQNLDLSLLEEIRLLSDMECEGHKLLNVFLVGQPELGKKLDLPEMEQLRQRIHLRFYLDALKEDEVKDYIEHRMSIAGDEVDIELDDEVIPVICLYTGGRPRLINVLCDHALTCAFVENTKLITLKIIEDSIEELNWIPYGKPIETVIAEDAANQFDHECDAKFVISSGKKTLGEYPITKDHLNIGRHKDNDIILDDSRVSRHHARVIVSGDDIFIRDMHSRNGTFAGVKQIEFHQLHDGDVITIGTFKLKYINTAEQEQEDEDASNILQYPVEANTEVNE